MRIGRLEDSQCPMDYGRRMDYKIMVTGMDLLFVLSTSKQISREHHEPSSIEFGRTISKMVRIEFDEHSKATHRSDIRQKRKLMTTSEKFYNRKKQHYSSYIKETHQKNAATNHDHYFLTVGSHAICPTIKYI
jgi:hypothetical protein